MTAMSLYVDYNDFIASQEILEILAALRNNHGTSFIDASKTFLALRTPFSEAKYSVVAPFFGFSSSPDTPFAGWGDLSIPNIMLPTAVIKKLVTKTIESFVSPGSIPELGNETVTGRFLSGTFQSLVCMFGGILRNKPEHSVPVTVLSSGGEFEGGIFCRDEMLIFVRELKHRHQLQKEFLDSLAQVLCELFAVWHLNRRTNADVITDKLIPVRACLCDGSETHFLSYDGINFSRFSITTSTSLVKGLEGVEEYMDHSLQANNYTFALLLEGYYDSLKLYYERSTHRGEKGDNGARGSHFPVAMPGVLPFMGARIDRHTTVGWYTALQLAYDARACLQRACAVHSNERAEQGLELLLER
ncbi:hypothetical protein DFH09DRAFT_1314267 [Mycena vulgaris]|nr:hypothetical protein DFH09DRAFT_1314267 [Mycena vulgaris]